ncbi:LacI family DNA-binding transcriptional regulator [Raineyella fluvialis]|uniref:LacI family DNA-binding transcriptional regulator n=1 Tax=Raineyella fluvialis TaxID=2662261 RepID=A0A5Q2F7U8_9ACTN|nr:LacI family DNA-binding transcriptional regulator [Raineyella fluvialis]QGF22982.1 LacI family DNA-binding transcriptional regulator [Raineyella fluvialis]
MNDPTQSDVARRAGVSRGLVSLALSGSTRVAPQTRRRIVAAAEELGYTRNLGAASLASARSPIVGVVLPNLRNPFFEAVVEAIQEAARGHALLPLVATASNDDALERSVVGRFQELRAAGAVLVSPFAPAATLSAYAELLPVVTVGSEALSPGVDAVHVDEAAAAELLVDHLLARGYREIIHLSPRGQEADPSVSVRRREQVRAMAAHGLSTRILEAEDDAGEVVRRLLAEDPPDVPWAITAHNDLMAMDAVAALRAAGVAVGRDVGVCGFDDTYLAGRAEFSLTSVDQHPALLGEAALDLLVARQADPTRPGQECVIAPRLSVRSST